MPITYDNIATTTLGGSATSINFSSIPSTYTDLRVVARISTSASMYLNGRFNGSSVLAYSETTVYGTGSSALSTRHNPYTLWQIEPIILDTANQFLFTMDIFSYASTSINKTFLQTFSGDKNGSGQAYFSVGRWNDTSAINALSLFFDNVTASFGAGTTVTLYGIKAA